MKNGKCEITKIFLNAEEVHCHHYIPIRYGGSDNFDNLRIIHKDIHILIHSTKGTTIKYYLNKLSLDKEQLERINQYRRTCNLENI